MRRLLAACAAVVLAAAQPSRFRRHLDDVIGCGADRVFVAARGTCDDWCLERKGAACVEACDTERQEPCGCLVTPWEPRSCARRWATKQCRCVACAGEACRADAAAAAFERDLMSRLLGVSENTTKDVASLNPNARARLLREALKRKDLEASMALAAGPMNITDGPDLLKEALTAPRGAGTRPLVGSRLEIRQNFR